MISIIIPLYNAEKYISDLLESLLNQTYKDFEIIIINDGSTDFGIEICKDYKERYSQIKIVNQFNQGVSKARNEGIRYSSGDYITFIDADDIVDAHFLENMIYCMDDDYIDLVCSGATIIQDAKVLLKPNYRPILVDKEKALDCTKDYYYGALWGKLFKKKIIKEFGIQFNNNVQIGEDTLFFVEYVLCSRNIYYTGVGDYCYFVRANSAMSQLNPDKQLSDLYARELILKLLSAYPELVRKHMDGYILSCIRIYKLFSMNNCLSDDLRKKIRGSIKKYYLNFVLSNNNYLTDKIKIVTILLWPQLIEKKWRKQ